MIKPLTEQQIQILKSHRIPNPASVIGDMFREMRPREMRSMRDFAEQEIILPTGPRKDFKYRCDFMPFSAGLFEKFESSIYYRFFGSGPVQGGKTMHFVVIPMMFYLFEAKEDVIFGAPTIDMACDIFEEKVKPVIEASRYFDLLPSKGRGSKGGRVKEIRFKNGAKLRFMGAQGDDSKRSSFTARIIIMTELDKMDTASLTSSRETDPVTQIERRSESFGDNARIFGECTMSVENGRVHREIELFGSGSKCFIKCPHCGRYITPKREQFTGWQDASDDISARDKSGYACDECAVVWNEADRHKALRQWVIADKGQVIEPDGKIIGDAPRTLTFGFSWNQMLSPLTTMERIANKEFHAQMAGTDEAMRDILQFTWALPYDAFVLERSEITIDRIMEHVRYSNYKKRANYPFVYDKKKVCVTGGIDVHKRSLVGVFNAFVVDEQGYLQNAYLLDWVIPYEIKDPDNPDALYRALCDVRDYLSDGWADSVGTRFGLNACGIDSGWQDTKRQMTRLVAGADYQVYRFSREYGQGTWRATKGQPNLDEGIIKNVLLEREKVYLWHIDTDLAKCEVHDIMRVPPGEVGFWHIAQDTPRLFGQGIAAEKREMVFDTKNREKAEWVRTDPYNHTLDASVYSWAMARALGVKPPRKVQEAS